MAIINYFMSAKNEDEKDTKLNMFHLNHMISIILIII